MCMHVLPVCISVHHVHVWCPQRPKEGFRPSKIIFVGGVFLCMAMQTVLGIILGYFALDVLFFLAKKFGG